MAVPAEAVSAVGERFSLRRRLGHGAFASVYLALHRLTQLPVAVKVVSRLGVADAVPVLLEGEAAAMRRFAHPNLVRCFETRHTLTHTIFVLEYMANGTLTDLLGRQPDDKLDADAARHVLSAVASGLAHMHDLGLVHRDIKTDNVFIGAHGRVKLGDFGFACPADKPPAMALSCGSAAYCAPEVFQVSGYHYKPADVWALGVLLHLCLYAQLPPGAGDTDAAPPIDSTSLFSPAGNNDPELVALLQSLLAWAPSDRITAADALNHAWLGKPGIGVVAKSLATDATVLGLALQNQPFASMPPKEAAKTLRGSKTTAAELRLAASITLYSAREAIEAAASPNILRRQEQERVARSKTELQKPGGIMHRSGRLLGSRACIVM